MHALAARKHREAGQPDIGEMLLEIDRGLLHMAEIEPFVGVEIEHQPIGLFQRRHRRRPAVELDRPRSEEHTSELQSLMRISYAVFCLKKKKTKTKYIYEENTYTN